MQGPSSAARYAALAYLAKIMEEIKDFGLTNRDVKEIMGISSTAMVQRWASGLTTAGPTNIRRLELIQRFGRAAAAGKITAHQLPTLFLTPQPLLQGKSPAAYIKSYTNGSTQNFTELTAAIEAGSVTVPKTFDPPDRKKPSRKAPVTAEREQQKLAEYRFGLAEVLLRHGFTCRDIACLLGITDSAARDMTYHRPISLSPRQTTQLEVAVTAALHLAPLYRRDPVTVRQQLLSTDCRNGLNGKSVVEVISALPDDRFGQGRSITCVNRALEALSRRTAMRA